MKMQKKLSCLLAVLISMISLLSINTKASSCYFSVSRVSGSYYMNWYGTPTSVTAASYYFVIDPDEAHLVTNLVKNGHSHTGTLTAYSNVDQWIYVGLGPRSTTSGGWYEKAYTDSTATFTGYLTCN